MLQPGSDTPHFCYNSLAPSNYQGTQNIQSHHTLKSGEKQKCLAKRILHLLFLVLVFDSLIYEHVLTNIKTKFKKENKVPSRFKMG